MSWDIHGNPLSRGHCEVHPHIGEEYPCSLCLQDSHYRSVASKEQQKRWDLEESFLLLQTENDILKVRFDYLYNHLNDIVKLGLDDDCKINIDRLNQLLAKARGEL